MCNTTTSLALFRLFIDDDGSTYDESTALYWDAPVSGHSTVQIDTFFPLAHVPGGGSLGVRTDTANALTFSVGGAEVS